MTFGVTGSSIFVHYLVKYSRILSSLFSRLFYKPFKRFVLRVVQVILRRWSVLSIPADYISSLVRSIPERSFIESVNMSVVDMTTIRHACFETYQYSSELPTAFRTEMHFARRHVYRMRNVCVNVHTGACCSKQYNFQESYGSVRRWLVNRPVSFKQLDPMPIDATVTCVHSTGFAHYLMEEVPRLLWTLQHYENISVLIPTKHPRFITSILSELKHKGHLKGNVIPCDKDVLMVQDFIFTQAEAYSGFWHAKDLSLLRSCFLPSDKQFEEKHNQIYISRLRSRRSYVNEAAVESYMQSCGIEIVYLEDMKFVEQIKLFSQAHMIISPHGGGLANLVWCSPGTIVIELFTSSIFNDCFARICSQLNCIYQPVWASDLSSGGVVDLDLLKKILLKQDIALINCH